MPALRYLLPCVLAAGCGRLGFEGFVHEVAVEAAYATGGDWSDHVLPDGSVCPYLEYSDQFYDACIHGGERRIVRVPAVESCDAVTIEDELAAFDWACVEEDHGITAVSRKLRPQVRLSHLLEPDRWRTNRVYIKRGDDLLAASAPAVWWQNPVVPAPDNASGALVLLDQPGTVYTVAESRETQGYLIAADRVAFTTLGDAVLSAAPTMSLNCDRNGAGTGVPTNPNQRCVVSSNQHAHVWIEGAFTGGAAASADIGVLLLYTQLAVLRHVRVTGFADDGVYIYVTSGTLVDELLAVGNGGEGFHDQYSYYGIHRDITVANNGQHGMRVYDGGPWRLTNIRAINNAWAGVNFEFDALGVLANVLAVGNGEEGVQWVLVDHYQAVTNRVVSLNNGLNGMEIGSLYENSLTHLVSLNNGGSGLQQVGGGEGDRFAQLVLANNAANGLYADRIERSTYTGNFVVGANGMADCVTTGVAAEPGIDDNCQSDANLVAGVDATNSFVGATDRTAPATAVTSWFEPPFTVWGRDATTLDAALRGPCVAGETCRAWDYSLALSDTVLRDAARTGAAVHEPLVPGAECPPAVHGDRVMRDASGICGFPNWLGACGRTFLLDAVELDDDYIGNDDGVCESDEACVYAPSFGLDLGRGELIGPCEFVDGLVSGVTMYARADS